MKRVKRLLAILLLIFVVAASVVPVSAASGPLTYSTESNSGERDELCTTLDGTNVNNYYKGSYTSETLFSQSGTTLYNTLNQLMVSTHKKNSSYNDCRDMSVDTDCENNDGRVHLLYSSYSVTRSDFGGSGSTWNREHVWPKSLGGYDQEGPGADLHHIRPTDATINSKRGNKRYGEVTNGTAVAGTSLVDGMIGGYYKGDDKTGVFEPLDNAKGDVARICLYMYVRYGKDSQYKCESILNIFTDVNTLLEWCELDPVDTWEMGRNEVVAAYQGNRNVFIDYPELAWLLFNEEVPENMATPSGGSTTGGGTTGGGTTGGGTTGGGTTGGGTTGGGTTGGGTTGGGTTGGGTTGGGTTGGSTTGGGTTGGGTTGGTTGGNTSGGGGGGTAVLPETCLHTETKYRNVRQANCTQPGYTGDRYCVACGEVLARGTTIQRNDVHAYEEDPETGDMTCVRCGQIQPADSTLIIAVAVGAVIAAVVVGATVTIVVILARKRAKKQSS